ncbi:MAG: hypothetical protein LJE84_07075 [Gammaproteobacteria bacterium]|nr:hypothetical protein [Gammaproteobacteria bacterium]
MTGKNGTAANQPRGPGQWSGLAGSWVLVCLGLLVGSVPLPVLSGDPEALVLKADPHRNEVGFFDIHVCNWPDRPPFFYSLFSTTKFADVSDIAVHYPDGRLLTHLRLDRYRLVQRKGKPEKRVFMLQTQLPAEAPDGWYTARVTTRDGKIHIARDYVIIALMAQAQLTNPPPGAEGVALPSKLEWTAIPGARHYQVWLRDKWDDGRVILTSRLLDEPRLVLPPGLVKPGGWYEWRVHARDVNEHVLLGDFNNGSLSMDSEFSVAGSEAR